MGGSAMNRIKKFLRNDSGSAEAASVAVMIGTLSSGLSGFWGQLTGNSSFLILMGIGGLLILWLIFKH